MTTTTLRPIGMSDEQTECDRCGRMELRGTVIIADTDGAETGRYGTSCASRVLGYTVTRQDALATEARRRSLVRDELRQALKAHKAGDIPTAHMYLAGARQIGIVRKDEKALLGRLEGAQ